MRRIGSIFLRRLICISSIALLAVALVPASGARAAEGSLVVSAGSASISGTGGFLLQQMGSSSYSCDLNFSGTVQHGDKSLEVTPSYSNCFHHFLGTNPSIYTNTGCHLRFYDLTAFGFPGEEKWSAKTDFVCSEKSVGVDISSYKGTTQIHEDKPYCKFIMPPFSEGSGAVIQVKPGGSLSLSIESGTAYEKTFGSAFNCGASFSATWTESAAFTAAAGTLGIE